MKNNLQKMFYITYFFKKIGVGLDLDEEQTILAIMEYADDILKDAFILYGKFLSNIYDRANEECYYFDILFTRICEDFSEYIKTTTYNFDFADFYKNSYYFVKILTNIDSFLFSGETEINYDDISKDFDEYDKLVNLEPIYYEIDIEDVASLDLIDNSVARVLDLIDTIDIMELDLSSDSEYLDEKKEFLDNYNEYLFLITEIMLLDEPIFLIDLGDIYTKGSLIVEIFELLISERFEINDLEFINRNNKYIGDYLFNTVPLYSLNEEDSDSLDYDFDDEYEGGMSNS